MEVTINLPKISSLDSTQLHAWIYAKDGWGDNNTVTEDSLNDLGVIRKAYIDKLGLDQAAYQEKPTFDDKGYSGEMTYEEHRINIEHRRTLIRSLLSLLIQSALEELDADGVTYIQCEFDGSHDSPNNIDSDIYLNDTERTSAKEAQILAKWSTFADFLSRCVETFYSVRGYENNEGGGGSAEIDVKNKKFKYQHYINEIRQEITGNEEYSLT